MGDATTVLFGLPGLRVSDVLRVNGEGELVDAPSAGTLRVVLAETDLDAEPAAAFCPACGTRSTSVRQHRTTRPRDVAHGEKPLAVRWAKRQYRCRVATCRRKAFTERLAGVPARARLTGRLRRSVGAAVDSETSVAGSAARHHVSWPTAHAAHRVPAERVLAARDAAGSGRAVLGIDETRRGRPRWQRQDDGRWSRLERFETNFVDLGDGHAVGSVPLLGQVAGRTSAAVTAWIAAHSDTWRVGVQVVAMDPCAACERAARAARASCSPDRVCRHRAAPVPWHLDPSQATAHRWRPVVDGDH